MIVRRDKNALFAGGAPPNCDDCGRKGIDGASEKCLRGLSGADEHGGVKIMAAGVYDPVDPGGVGDVNLLLDRQRVHVSPQEHRRVRERTLARTDHHETRRMRLVTARSFLWCIHPPS
jgi:hypothetical protein